jgi:hypothetical protein
MGEGVPTIGVDPKRGFYFMGRLPFWKGAGFITYMKGGGGLDDGLYPADIKICTPQGSKYAQNKLKPNKPTP